MSKKWVREDDWSKVAVGDRVKLVQEERPKTYITIKEVRSEHLMLASKYDWYSRRDGWTLYVRAPKAPGKAPLPEEPGVYIDQDKNVWKLLEKGWRYQTGVEGFFLAWPPHVTSLTRLEPVPDTAKEVLDRYNDLTKAGYTDPNLILGALRIEFGVTE